MDPRNWQDNLLHDIDSLGKLASLLSDGGTTIVGFVAAVVGVVVWMRSRSFRRILARQRRQLLHDVDIASGPLKDSIAHRVRECLEFELYSVYHETTWLIDTQSDPDTQQTPRGLAFHFSDDELHRLADAYRLRARKLASRRFPRAADFPLLTEHIQMFRRTADYLDLRAHQVRIFGSKPAAEPASSHGFQLIRCPQPSARLFHFDLLPDWQRYRIIAPTAGAQRRADAEALRSHHVQATPEDLIHLNTVFQQPGYYDRVVPALVASRVESDESSGRPYLHLSLAEMSWGAVKLTHLDGATSTLDASYLAVAMIPITIDNELAFVQRAGNARHPGLLAPAVLGDLELLPTEARQPEVDDLGFPCPARALVRESREGIGVRVDADRIQWTGLGRIDTPTESGTHVLVGHVALKMDRFALRKAIHGDSTPQGRWRHTGDIFTLSLTQSTPLELMRWCATSTRLTPHAKVAALCTISSHLGVDIPDLDSLLLPPTTSIIVESARTNRAPRNRQDSHSWLLRDPPVSEEYSV